MEPDASHPEIKKAWRQWQMVLRPDRAQGAGPEELQFRQEKTGLVNEAWSVLGDERKRREYDARRAGARAPEARPEGRSPAGAARPSAPRPAPGAGGGRRARPRTWEDILRESMDDWVKSRERKGSPPRDREGSPFPDRGGSSQPPAGFPRDKGLDWPSYPASDPFRRPAGSVRRAGEAGAGRSVRRPEEARERSVRPAGAAGPRPVRASGDAGRRSSGAVPRRFRGSRPRGRRPFPCGAGIRRDARVLSTV